MIRGLRTIPPADPRPRVVRVIRGSKLLLLYVDVAEHDEVLDCRGVEKSVEERRGYYEVLSFGVEPHDFDAILKRGHCPRMQAAIDPFTPDCQ